MTYRALLKALATVSFGLATAVASAQFVGAGLSPTDQLNKPTVLTTDQGVLYPAGRDFHLSTGDLITVHLFGQSEYMPTVRLGEDGQVLLPLIGLVKLDGLTVPQAEEYIARKLSDAGMYKDPQVTVQVLEGPNATITVIGETHGVVTVAGSKRLLDVLAATGGLPASASHVITINRPGVAQPIVVDLGTDPAQSAAANIPVFSGDTVVVGRMGVVYVVGAFKNQGAIPLVQSTPLTLLQATALSGGPLYEGKYDDLHLIRTIGTQRTVVKLDIQKVLYGKAPDPILQPNDIVFLPSSTLKAAISNGGVSVVLGLASLAVSAIAINH